MKNSDKIPSKFSQNSGKIWLRLYAEFAGDPKVQTMSEAMQRRLIMLLCLRCGDALQMLDERDLALALRITQTQLAKTKQLFLKKGFINEDWHLLNWNKRQFSSDTSTERTRRYRSAEKLVSAGAPEEPLKRHGNVPGTSRERSGNGPETETETDIESTLCMKTVQSQKLSGAREAKFPHTHPVPVNGNGHRAQAPLASLPHWEKTCTAARQAGMVYDPSPQSEAARQFRGLSLPERIAAIEGIHKRIACGEYDPAQPAFTHTLENYLARKIWRQGVRPQTRGQPERRQVGSAMARLAKGATASD